MINNLFIINRKTAIFNKPEFNFLRDITKTISDVNPVEEDNTLQNNNNNINSEDNRLATTNTSTIIFSSNNNSSNSRVRQINMVNNPSLPISYIPTSVPATLNQINNNNCHNVPRTRGRPRKRPMDVDSEPSCSSTSKTAKKKLKGKTNYSDDDDDSELEDNDDDNESTSEDEEGDDDNDDHIDEDDTQETKETGENVSSNYPFDLSMKFNSSKKSSTITSTNNIFGAPNEQIPNDEDDYDNC